MYDPKDHTCACIILSEKTVGAAGAKKNALRAKNNATELHRSPLQVKKEQPKIQFQVPYSKISGLRRYVMLPGLVPVHCHTTLPSVFKILVSVGGYRRGVHFFQARSRGVHGFSPNTPKKSLWGLSRRLWG